MADQSDLSKQLNCTEDSFHTYSQSLLQIILDDSLDNDEKKELIKKYSLTFKQIDWMVKNNLYTSYWKKKWTSKIKTEFKKNIL